MKILFFTLFFFPHLIFSDDYVVKKTSAAINTYQIELKFPYFLGNGYRQFYGKGPVPKKLDIIWKKYLGGTVIIQTNKKKKKWYGMGWPSQPTMVKENGKDFLLVGSLNSELWKIEARTGKTIWKHRFNNVIKGTPTLYINPMAKNKKEKGMVFCGSRRDMKKIVGKNKEVKFVKTAITKNFRAVSLLNGELLWALNIPQTDSYSRDVDGNVLIIDDLLYLGAENGFLYIINPNPSEAKKKDGFLQPKIIDKLKLYSAEDIKKHKNNLVIESSPSVFGDMVYITAGSGHVYGVNISSRQVIWDFYIGADLDSTPVITSNGYLLVGVEKQYIKGKGGVFKLDPKKSPKESVVWYCPVEDKRFAEWEGGVIGSVGINDEYNADNEKPSLAAFCTLEGNLYIVSQDELDFKKVKGPNLREEYSTPKIVKNIKIGPSISTPIFVDNYLIACGYDGFIRIFEIIYEKTDDITGPNIFKNKKGLLWKIEINESAKKILSGSIESTPLVCEGKIYIGTKGGHLYCLGEGEKYSESRK